MIFKTREDVEGLLVTRKGRGEGRVDAREYCQKVKS